MLEVLAGQVSALAGTGGLLIALICMASACCPADAREDAFYAGRTLRIIVGLPPGGGADAYARLVQRHLAQYLPGAPAIVVENVPGAGSLKSVEYLQSQPVDGTAMATFSSGLLTEALTAPLLVKADFRSFAWIGNISEDVRVCYLWHTAGVRTWQDALARPQIIFADSAAGTAGNTETAMLRDLFGLKIKRVRGYAGSAAKRLAVERGEVDGDCGGWSALPQDWLKEREIDVFVRLSPRLLPGMDPKVPFAGDLLANKNDRPVFDFLMAPEKLGRLFMVSGKVPADRIAVLRKAFDAMVADPAFIGEAEKLRLTVTPMTGDEVAHDVGELYAAPPALIARVKSIVGE